MVDDYSVPAERADERGTVAVGFVVTDANGDGVLRELLRAQDLGYETLVTYVDSADEESIQFADQLGAAVVAPAGPNPTVEQTRVALEEHARRLGLDGLLFQTPYGDRIDFQRSRRQLASGRFTVDAVPVHDTVQNLEGRFVLVGIPAYNESRAIGDVVRTAREYADHVLVVDDGSGDDTAEVAREAGATVVEHGHNRGYGAALQTLFQAAINRSADHLVVLDGDGQHDPSDVPRLVAHQRESGSEIVIGSRAVEDGKSDASLLRRFGLWIINWLTNLSLGRVRAQSCIGDTQSGFRVYDQRAISALAAETELNDSMSASIDILYHATRHNFAIDEVSTTVTYDVPNASTHSPLSHGLTILHNIARLIERDRPISALGIPGLLSTLIGFGFAYWTIVVYADSGLFRYGLAITSSFFTLAGIFLVFTSILLHSLNHHLETT
jgi:glycosyltransferase involved in cell wall biosynthesis